MKRVATLCLTVALALPALTSRPAAAEGTLRIVEQFGVGYLPLHVLRDGGLVEKHGRAAGVEITVEWAKLSGGAAVNDALLSGSVDVASGGVAPLLTLWDRTRGSLDVKAISALVSMPYYLLTNRPEVRTIADFGPGDRIALPTAVVSLQARTLQMAAAGLWGAEAFDRLDELTVTLPHPDATAALLSGGTEITGHFSTPPYQQQALRDPKVHRVLSSYEVLGGPATAILLWTTSRFRAENPKTYAAFLGALDEAVATIERDKDAAAATYVRVEKSKLEPAFIRSILDDPEVTYTLTPQQTDRYAAFMAEVGAIKQKPASWRDYFFDDVHDRPGS